MASLDNRSIPLPVQLNRHERILLRLRGGSLRRITASAALLAAVGLTFVLVG